MFAQLSNVLNSIDSAAKDTLEDVEPSAILLRQQRRGDLHADNRENDPNLNDATNLHELEKLSREILDLEDQNTSLKREVKEAWDNYKSAQEKAAAKEIDLLDEIKQIKAAKQIDKQQFQSQLVLVSQEKEELRSQIQILEADNQQTIQHFDNLQKESEGWKSTEAALLKELEEARATSFQGVHTLREDLRHATAMNEQIRIENASLIRQHQIRFENLERENVDLTQKLGEKQRELTSLKSTFEATGGLGGRNNQIDSNSNHHKDREIEILRQENIEISRQFDDEKEKTQLLERRARQLEIESRAQRMTIGDEKDRYESTISDLSSEISRLNDRLKEPRPILSTAHSLLIGGTLSEELADHTSTGSNSSSEDMNVIVSQVQNLSKQLLRKQGQVLELQAEKAAMKSVLDDTKSRCQKIEKELSRLKVGEDDDEDDEEGDIESGPGNRSSTAGIRKRNFDPSHPKSRSKKSGSRAVSEDLEQLGVKTGPGVRHAVDMIDTWTLVTGRFLRIYPLFRFGFVLYLMILHLWVLFILALHTHSLEEANSVSGFGRVQSGRNFIATNVK